MPNFNWSEPEIQEPYIYENKFGKVVFEPVTDFMPVSDITRENVPEINEVLVSLDHAEQITLVTENRRACMSFCFPFLPEDQATFGLKYSCSSRAAVCRVTIQRFGTPGNISAQEQIEAMAPKAYGPLSVN